MNGKKYRNEYKYLISAAQMEMLKVRADALLRRDSHVNSDGPYAGIYNIRSLYFDDRYDTCYWENESGTDPREKFRIRIYNHSDQKISLELKSKHSGKCLKQSCSLTRCQCESLIRGIPLPENPSYPSLLQKLLIKMNTRSLRPVVIVEYDRIPYVYSTGNVRVTMDCNVCGCTECERFFEENLSLRPILPVGQHILEVKWDELLPDFIYRTMMLEDLRWTSFSKFYLCRKMTRNY